MQLEKITEQEAEKREAEIKQIKNEIGYLLATNSNEKVVYAELLQKYATIGLYEVVR